MSSAMRMHVPGYDAGDEAAPSLTYTPIAEHEAEPARLPGRLVVPWPFGRTHRDTLLVAAGRERERGQPGRNNQWTIPASCIRRVDAGGATWNRKEVGQRRERVP